MLFKEENEKQPLLCHKSLLDFVKRYKITLEQKETLGLLLQKHMYEQITKEIIDILQKAPPKEECQFENERIPTY